MKDYLLSCDFSNIFVYLLLVFYLLSVILSDYRLSFLSRRVDFLSDHLHHFLSDLAKAFPAHDDSEEDK